MARELVGIENIGTQTVVAGGEINMGNIYRKYCRTINGIKTFEATSTGVRLQREGIYHLTAVLVGSGAEAGDVSVQLFENGRPITSAISTQTITTADTEFRTFVIDYYILVDKSCILGCNSTIGKTLTLENVSEIGATFVPVVVNITKEA